ncbi:unnamed protein product [Psylliodes chrysocephalus]|uniref:Uncharacterized protein n=1 Tax=Psylliodes chrysocephalus TaxID=3402493 RepID=A0A9P0CML7_9CUCU|nr:unnamed protein product [Psylliodes chrysocephala]
MPEKLNFTEFDDDPFADTGSDTPIQEELLTSVYSVVYYSMFFTETVKLFLSIILVVADSYLAITIYKDKKQTKSKKLIMHFAIIHILLFVSSPLLYILMDITNIMNYVKGEFYLCLLAIEQLSCILSLLLASGLAMEWLIMVYNPKFNGVIKFFYNNLIMIFYIVTLSQFIIQFVSLAFEERWLISHFIFRISLFVVSLLLIWCNYLKYRNRISMQAKKGYSLIVANIITFSWIPLYILDILLHYTSDYRIFHAILLLLWFIPEWLAFGNTLIVMYVLAKYNIYFQNYYDKLFKRGVRYRDDEEYLNESFDESSTKNVTTTYENVYV